MKLHPATIPSVADYDEAFHAECAKSYPEVRQFEVDCGFWVERPRLEAAARVLACPVKQSPPNWQHGRILYAAIRRYLASGVDGPVRCVDIGTAKGFSALVAQWALDDACVAGKVESVDVIDPLGKVFRNSVHDVGRSNRLADYLTAWPEASAISFYQSTGIAWLQRSTERVHVAFVDGKHLADVVATEGRLLAERQQAGDLVMFDDVQIPGVQASVLALHDHYDLQILRLDVAHRAYAVGVRR